jgi:urease gamma subunit
MKVIAPTAIAVKSAQILDRVRDGNGLSNMTN